MEIKELLMQIQNSNDRIDNLLEQYQDDNCEELEISRQISVDGSGTDGKQSKTCVIVDGGAPIVTTFNEDFTNNEMEYLAMIQGMILAKEGDTISSDSELVLKQLSGEYKCKAGNLKILYLIASMLHQRKQIILQWVSRKNSLAGKELEK